MFTKFKSIAVLAAVGALTLSVTACGGNSTSVATGSNGLIPVSVLVVPNSSQASVFLGVDQGLFRDAGLDVTIESATDANAITSAVTTGSAAFGAGGLSAQLLAIGQGVPVKVVAAQSAETEPATPTSLVSDGTIFVAGDSAITTPADLANKKIAVNGLVSNSTMVLKAALELNGVDPNTVDVVQVNFPEQIASLQAGQVDAIVSAEPFTSAAVQAGLRPVLAAYPYAPGTQPMHLISSWFTSSSFAEQNPDVVTKFRAGLLASQQYAAANPDQVRAAITKYASVPADRASQIILPDYPETTDPALVDAEIQLVKKYLAMTQNLTAADVLVPTS